VDSTNPKEEDTMKTVPAAAPRFTIALLPHGKDVAPGVDRRALDLLAGAAVEIVRAHPGARRGHDSYRLAHLVWAQARGLVYDAASGRTVEGALAAACRPEVDTCARVVDVLLEAGDLRRTLTAQRDALDVQIRQLEAGGA
jgi:hypothetical protein